MKFNINPLSYEDYDNILVDWWESWGFKPPARDFLPQNAEGGLMVWKEKTPVCAGFLYTTNSNVGWIEWIISDKEYRDKDRQQAVVLLISELERISKNIGIKYIFSNNDNNRLIETFHRLGYNKGAKSVEMVKHL